MANLNNTIISDTGFLDIPAGTTAERPTGLGVEDGGLTRFNTTYNVLEYWDGSSWRAADGLTRGTASGATDESLLTNGAPDGKGTHQIWTFTGSGTFTLDHGGYIEYLVVAGGGAGGYYVGGGGGGGGFLEGGIDAPSGTYTVTVGAGGTGSTTRPPPASTRGDNSSIVGPAGFTTIESFGGGGGGSYNGYEGISGGSSGGQGGPDTGSSVIRAPLSVSGQGSHGGVIYAVRSGTPTNGSGGGGAGGCGYNEPGAGVTVAPKGGSGRQSYVCPYRYYYSGGGGGGAYNSSSSCTGGDGGIGGGGGGATSHVGSASGNTNASYPGFGGPAGFSRNGGGIGGQGNEARGGDGGQNTGGGSGGAGHDASNTASSIKGGSGIVIVRWLRRSAEGN
jgi:hypothetical protein